MKGLYAFTHGDTWLVAAPSWKVFRESFRDSRSRMLCDILEPAVVGRADDTLSVFWAFWRRGVRKESIVWVLLSCERSFLIRRFADCTSISLSDWLMGNEGVESGRSVTGTRVRMRSV